MAREFGRLYLSLNDEPEWRQYDPWSQWLYMTLIYAPDLSYAGVADWRPRRIAKRASGVNADYIEQAAFSLEQAHWLIIDRDTEEVLLRSFIRNDKFLDKPNVAIACAKAWKTIASPVLRGVVSNELARLEMEDPEQNCFTNERSQPWMQAMLRGEVIGPDRALELLDPNPFGERTSPIRRAK